MVVNGRTVAPVDSTERHFEPNVVPVTITRHALQINLDAGLGSRLLEHLARIGCTREGAFGHLQLDGRADVGLLEVELGLVRVISDLILLGIEVLHARPDGVVIAHCRVAGEHVRHDLVAIDTVLQSQHQVFVGVRIFVGMSHKSKAVAHARRACHFQRVVLGQQGCSLGIDAVDQINLTRHERLGARSRVADVAQLNPVEITAVRLPVVARLTLEHVAHAGLELLKGVSAGAVWFAPVGEAIRHHDDVVVAEVVGQVDVALAHRDLNLCRRRLLDVGDVSQQGFGR